MAKMVILVLFLFLSVCAQADKLKDTLFLQKTDPHHLYYADKDVVLESSVSLFEIIYDNIRPLFPGKNIDKDGPFFYYEHIDHTDRDMHAFFSYETDSIYIIVDPSWVSKDFPVAGRIGRCLKKHFMLNFGRYQKSCSKAIPLKPKLKEWLNLLREHKSEILYASRPIETYELIFRDNGADKEFYVPDISKIQKDQRSIVLDFYEEISLLLQELIEIDFSQCRWDKLVDNPERFYISHGNQLDVECEEP
ncbi:hypothetical protein SAMN05720472_0611 [Fibrobacter sp. UWR3]|uniref:hypothetical protein n=1 Tax=Fibrobacter sp. UWR3 TaxID=1896217 RepID=UPI00091F8BD0|nr:hypothetical protein [Fibrobacter sp. UWR3]SHM16343.1 hypothetical protein SAMN05720472_0611 [Fibrobacter sp. UWR3]